MYTLVKNNFCLASRMTPSVYKNQFSQRCDKYRLQINSRVTLPLESRNKCFTNVFNILDVSAINLFFFFTWKAEFSNIFLFHVLIDVRIVFKKICASKVLRDGYGNLIRSGEPQVIVTWADLIFW